MTESTCSIAGRLAAWIIYGWGAASIWLVWMSLRAGRLKRLWGKPVLRANEPLEYWTGMLVFATGALLVLWQLTRGISVFCVGLFN